MKKLLTSVLTGVVALGALSGCTGGGGGTSEDAQGRTVINVACYAAGYGTGWIEEACRLYEEEHPEYKFSIEANARMFDTIKTRLDAGTCNADIVLIANANYRNFVAKGYLEDLTSVYESVIPDTESTKVKDVIPQEHITYRTIGEGIYGMPWQDAGATGFIYNKKLFRDNNWSLPTTMDEFFALCDTIAATTDIAPLTFGGGQQGAYSIGIINQWFAEYYGYDYIQNTFQKYDSPQIYQDTYEGRLKAYQTAARMFKGKAANGESIVLDGSIGQTAQAAQRALINGKAAMTICGPWFPTEMQAILKGKPDFEYGYLGTPHINADKKDAFGNDSSSCRYSLDGNILAVPSNSKYKDVAKDFLLSMYTKESYTTFVKENKGLLRPVNNLEIDPDVLDDFSKEVYNYGVKGKQAGQYVYEVSLSPMFEKGHVALLISQNGNTVGNLLNAADYEAAMSVASVAAADDYTRASAMWDNVNNKWKDEYLGVE